MELDYRNGIFFCAGCYHSVSVERSGKLPKYTGVFETVFWFRSRSVLYSRLSILNDQAASLLKASHLSKVPLMTTTVLF